MTSISLLLLGLLLGIRHATEADHLAAVASLATRSRSLRSTVAQGVAWGFGHTLTLFVVGGICLLLRATIPARVAAVLEAAVGVMLLYLGADVLRRLCRQGLHVHVHHHADGAVHLHAHRHGAVAAHAPLAADAPHPRHAQRFPNAGHEEAPPDAIPAHAPPPAPHKAHLHEHAHGLPHRALLVGLVHGMAGSAALLLMTITTFSSPWLGLAYIAVFGAGSILGMAALAAVIALPLHGPAPALAGWYRAIEAAIGVSTLLIGTWVLHQAPWSGWLAWFASSG